jgi:hypothetical protein
MVAGLMAAKSPSQWFSNHTFAGADGDRGQRRETGDGGQGTGVRRGSDLPALWQCFIQRMTSPPDSPS